ncbi:choice-of-anchor B family protein [Neolewinella lacunae]|uniref:Choice-of-anchor B family protein n=1 Tax=Neolewinella lacunae TaxID=1517758 RepID=A0A923TDH8_9BACT|nr:choice-of-anchor B family protein [Neolewinella lacunae]MBC6994857.1 choice-of-anchor B family protein [Neolewinella lacunae]MDN3636777.1 choice-of-anchor B family protein [Neolewinella lacunae]
MTYSVFKLLSTIFCFLLLATTSAFAQQSQNMSLLGQWTDATLPISGGVRYNDVWGYAAGGREYALIGSRQYVIVLDVTDPSNITEIARLNAYSNSQSTWRDIKVFGNYAYCVTEAAEGLQIIDLSQLPTTATLVGSPRITDFLSCHNIFIDASVSPAKLYMFGTNSGAQSNGYLVYSLQNPADPQLLASVNLRTAPFTGGYIHDAYAIHDTLYANSERRGMFVYDVADPANPVEIGILSQYQQSGTVAGYNHSSWRTQNGDYMVMCDETTSKPVYIVDVRDPADMEVVSTFKSTSLAPSTNSLAHNPYVLGDSLVVISYYGEGIQVWDIRDPTSPSRIGYFDTSFGSSSYVDGTWGAYPYLPSGNILGSDMENGLFVVGIDDLRALPVSYQSWEATTTGKDVELTWSTTTETDNAGWTVEHATENGQFAAVGSVPPSLAANYRFVHANPGPGTHFYRLRQRDFDGTEALSTVRAVVMQGVTTAAVWPNPAPSGTPLFLAGVSGAEPWVLREASGRPVLSGTGSRIAQNLSPGFYLLTVGGQTLKLVVH